MRGSVAKLLSSFIAPRRLAARWRRCGGRPQSPRRRRRRRHCSIVPSGGQTPSVPSLTLLACSLLYTQDRLSFTQSGGGSTPQSKHTPPNPTSPSPLHAYMPPHSNLPATPLLWVTLAFRLSLCFYSPRLPTIPPLAPTPAPHPR